MNNNIKKPLTIFSLVAINVIAIDSLRGLPFSEEYGFSAVFYYLLAAITFFIPVSLVSAELATAWPETGGLYVWVREAFGNEIGFLTIWLQWFYNIAWYPTQYYKTTATISLKIQFHFQKLRAPTHIIHPFLATQLLILLTPMTRE